MNALRTLASSSALRLELQLAILTAALASAAVADLIEETLEGTSLVHRSIEFVLVSAALLTLLRIFKQTKALETAYRQSEASLSSASQEAEKWKENATQYILGLSQAIDAQLKVWQLTPAEMEIALLLLKGLGLKEIAFIRETSERTVRQQAQAVYQKAGLAGRAELSAFFLEDLLTPRDAYSGDHKSHSA